VVVEAVLVVGVLVVAFDTVATVEVDDCDEEDADKMGAEDEKVDEAADRPGTGALAFVVFGEGLEERGGVAGAEGVVGLGD